MNILCDEHVPPAVVNALEGEGFSIRTVADELSLGTPDAEIPDHANEQDLAFLTNDSDFVGRDGHCGVLYYDNQRVSHRELVRAIRTVDDLLSAADRRDQTIYVPDGWV